MRCSSACARPSDSCCPSPCSPAAANPSHRRAFSTEYGHRFRYTEPLHPLPIRQDPRLLELILTNLVENGCKFTAAGGQISLSLTPTGQSLAIAVSDTGPGIPAAELPLIFDRFHRGAETQEIPGSGLGLSIVQEAARRLGTTVSVSSTPGRGSTFTLLLPLQK